MKNIHILPTDKPSRLSILNSGKLNFGAEFISSSNSKAQNIYIINNETIKEGDYIINIESLGIFQHHYKDGSLRKQLRKIILTTDKELIKDGVQEIDDTFLEWFIKNPSCEFVRIGKGYFKNDYEQSLKIIIPSEEVKQETPKEITERYYEDEV